MPTTDPIGDMLTRIRNGAKARLAEVAVPRSKVKEELARVLREEGYILGYAVLADTKQGLLKIALKYDRANQSVIEGIRRVSRPGRRSYSACGKIPRTMSGLGVTIISSSQGMMSDLEARRRGVGGEVICRIW